MYAFRICVSVGALGFTIGQPIAMATIHRCAALVCALCVGELCMRFAHHRIFVVWKQRDDRRSNRQSHRSDWLTQTNQTMRLNTNRLNCLHVEQHLFDRCFTYSRRRRLIFRCNIVFVCSGFSVDTKSLLPVPPFL